MYEVKAMMRLLSLVSLSSIRYEVDRLHAE